MSASDRFPASRSQATVMLSRVAHSLYWMSRFIERAENTARLLEVNLQFHLDYQNLNDIGSADHWDSILASSGYEELFSTLHETADSHNVTDFLALDPRNPSSIISCIFAARENARMIRDQISVEMWETINELYLFLKGRDATEVWANGRHEFFQDIKRHSHLFQGLTEATYSRNEGWEFIQFGKLIERADKTTRILDVKYHILLPNASDVGGAIDTMQWRAVLRSASALEAYHRFYVHEILPWKVAEFLLFSESFPRALQHCVVQIDQYLCLILAETGTVRRTAGGLAASRLLGDLRSLTITDVLEQGLHEFLLYVQKSLDRISEEVVQTTMFYPVEVMPEEEQHQQQQQ